MENFGYFKGDIEYLEAQLPERWQPQLHQLRAIDFAKTMKLHWPSRAFIVGATIAFAFLIIGFFLIEYLSKAGIEFFLHPKQRLLVPISSFSAGIVGATIAAKTMRGYTAILDEHLANYTPVDEKAYKELQNSVDRHGELLTFLVRDWIQEERKAIATAAGVRYVNKSKFANKVVNVRPDENRQ